MNGKPSAPIIVETIDYREIAKPLTFRMIKEDLDALYLAGAPEPKKLVLWEHQADWLVKAEREGEPLEDLSARNGEYIFGRGGGKTLGLLASLFPRPAIWGVPVELHRPLIESELRRSVEKAYEQFAPGAGSYHFTHSTVIESPHA